ncbi:helix-turn-helix transcriptional regulator [Herpetosiphon gulosus]|uniref:HTH-type transcriptional activator RamA n=1 Tax=Herpetosiphon gulosus TaxID=1973496 RepID=A0ABP9WYU5_9CHLR
MHSLSARECDVLALVDQGWSDAEIAKRLSISIWTVRTHLRSSASKLGVKSRQQAAHAARAIAVLQQATTAKNR